MRKAVVILVDHVIQGPILIHMRLAEPSKFASVLLLPMKYFVIFLFKCLTWSLTCGLTSNKLTHKLLVYGDFEEFTWLKWWSVWSALNLTIPLQI